MLPEQVDVLIVGAGFGGSLLAQILAKSGLRIALVERGAHPRFAMGESTSPLTNLLLEQFAETYNLPHLNHLATWGAWKVNIPDVGVGLKRGFTYYGHPADGSDTGVRGPLAVAASPGNSCADTHWLRSDVDAWLCQKAIDEGVHYVDKTAVVAVNPIDGGRWSVRIIRENGTETTIDAGFLVDAGGRTAALAKFVGSAPTTFTDYPDTVALYSHFDGVALAASMSELGEPEGAPYPIDWSALHHCFPGGWMWMLRFDDNRVSAGVAVERWLADDVSLLEDGGWERLLSRMPAVEKQFAGATRVLPWMQADPLPVRLDRVAGQLDSSPWAFLPSASAFIDPLYSTGFSLTLLGIERLAPLILNGCTSESDLATYEAAVKRDIDCVARYIAANYKAFSNFERFTDISMFYFAAASWSEICRRIGKRELAPGMLLSGDSAFWGRFDAYLAGECTAADAIAPWNIAGLADASKNGMYGANLTDVIAAAGKLGLTQAQMEAIIADAEWARCD